MDQELKIQLDRIEKFMHKHLVTKQEFSELTERVSKLEESVERLTNTVEKLVTAINKIADEHTVLKHQVTVMQDWIREASKKLGIEFKL